MCVGGSLENDPLLIVIACANCLNVTTQTILNNPQFYGAAYWYFTINKSFGYSPTSTITQNDADLYDRDSNFRLSWHLDNFLGGYRLGNLTGLNENTTYSKKIFIN